MADMGKKWGALPFDTSDPADIKADAARRMILESAIHALEEFSPENGHELQAVAGGLLVGLLEVMMSMMPSTDANHASLQAGLLQLLPWAVDQSRSISGLPPLNSDRTYHD
jgi:hypothetical protein